ncbi:hypothetical protein SH2C18_25790 [Clostridium sediminicola]|uniref:hypothetical protein n=1 Tax=Clostridium sediminicola TaxID=3114879 RepID=UPI0031F27C74
MKRLIMILLSLVIIYTIVGCSTDEYKKLSEEERLLLDMVIYSEQNKYDLLNNEISLTDYRNNVQSIFSSKFSENQRAIFGFEGREYTESDLENITDEEVEKLIDNLNESVNKTVGKITYEPIAISGVYEEPDVSFKYIFLKTNKTLEKVNKEITVFTKYTFSKENAEWKVLGIETKSPREKEDIETLKNFKNEQIEYIEEFDLSKS